MSTNPYERCLRHQDCLRNADVARACARQRTFRVLESIAAGDITKGRSFSHTVQTPLLLEPRLVVLWEYLNAVLIGNAPRMHFRVTLNGVNVFDGPNTVCSETSTVQPLLPDMCHGDHVTVHVRAVADGTRAWFYIVGDSVGEGDKHG